MLKKNIQTSLHRFVVRFFVFRLDKCRKQTLTDSYFRVQKSCKRPFKCKVKIYQAALSCLKNLKQKGIKRSQFWFTSSARPESLIFYSTTGWTSFKMENRREDRLLVEKFIPINNKIFTDHFCPWGRKIKRHFVKSVNSFHWSSKKLTEKLNKQHELIC